MNICNMNVTKRNGRIELVSFDKITSKLDFHTIHRPQESVEQIVTALENGLISDRILQESVNIK